MNRRILSLVLIFTLSLVAVVAVNGQDDSSMGPVTERIMERGEVICGMNQSVRGFGFANDEGEFEGFDIEYCKAVAVALFNDADAVSYRPLTGAERQAAIQSGEIDMMARNTTWTISRDVTWNATFGPTNFYDGQGVMTLAEFDVSSIPELDGSSMCVQTGTTTELNITDYIEANGLEIEIIPFPDADSTWSAYIEGRCESWTTDKSGLAAFRSGAEDPGAHVILSETLSKEPLGPLSPQEDPQFADIIRWVTWGLVQAEEFGITSENVGEFLPTEGESDDEYLARVSPAVARFLGQANQDSGNFLGIDNDFMVNVISEIGNYGEIYERHLVPIGLTREGTLNALYTEGGLMYAPPFR